MATPSSILSLVSSALGRASGLPGNYGIAAAFGSALLGIGADLLQDSPRTHVQRVDDAAPRIADAVAAADALKARLRAGGAS